MLSIIVPTLNEEMFIERTLVGIKRLQGIPYELIVSDSGSSDSTVAIARRHADKVVQYADRPRNAGRGRNEGARAAQGDLLVFIDADVTLQETSVFFNRACKEFERDPHLVAIGARVKALPEVETWGDWISHKIINFNCFVINNILHGAAISGEFQMMRTSAFQTAGGYNEKLTITEDNELYSRLRKIGRIRLVRELWVMHPSRRAHAIGWPRLWWELGINWIFVTFLGRTWHDSWRQIR